MQGKELVLPVCRQRRADSKVGAWVGHRELLENEADAPVLLADVLERLCCGPAVRASVIEERDDRDVAVEAGIG